MAKIFEIGFRIGGQIRKSFSGSLTSATKNLDALRKQISVLESSKAGIEKFRNLRHSIEGTRTKLEQARQKTAELGKQLHLTKKPTEKLKNAFKASRNEASKLKNKLNQQRESLHRLKQGMQQTGMQTNNLARQQTKLAKSIDRVTRAQNRARRIAGMRQGLKDRRANLRGQMLDAVGMGYLLQLPFRPAVEFEHAMQAAKVRTGAAGNLSQSKMLEEEARRLGRTTPFKAFEVAQAMTELGIAGYEAEPAKKATKDVLNLAMSTGLTVDLARSAEILSNVANQFGLKGNTTKVADALVRGFSKSSTTLESIFETMKYLANLPSDAGMSIEQTMGAIGVLGDVGIKGSLAGTAIKRSLLNIKAGSPALQELGVQRYEVDEDTGEKRLRNYYEILGDILKGLQRYDKEAQDRFINEIFGDRAVAAMSTMLKQIDKGGIDKILKKMAGSFSAEQTGVEMMKTTKGSLLELASALESFAISFSQLFLPAIRSATEFIKRLTGSLEWLVNTFPVATKVVGGVIFGLVGLKVASIALGYAFTFLGGALLSPIQLFSNLAALLTLVKTRTLGTAVAIKLLNVGINVTKIKAFGLALWESAKWLALHTASVLRLGAVMGAQTIWSGLVAGLGFLKTALMGFATTAIPAVIAGIKAIGVAILTTPIGWIAAAIAGVAAAVWYFWEPIKEAYNWIVEKVLEWDLFESGISLIKSFAQGIWAAVKWPFKAVSDVLAYVRDLLPFSDAKRGPLSKLTNSGMSIVQTLGAGIHKAGSGPLERPLSTAFGQLQPTLPKILSLDEWCRQKGVERWPGRREGATAGKREVTINLNVIVNGESDKETFRQVVEQALPKALERVSGEELRLSYAQ